jgi:hypothetical protein
MPFLPTPSIGYFIKYFIQKSDSLIHIHRNRFESIHCEIPALFPLSLPGNREPVSVLTKPFKNLFLTDAIQNIEFRSQTTASFLYEWEWCPHVHSYQ